jgi:hypothetical protein
MPVKLSTTLSKLLAIPNGINAKLLEELHLFMKKNDCSENHRNNTLKTSIAFANFLGPEQSFHDCFFWVLAKIAKLST